MNDFNLYYRVAVYLLGLIFATAGCHRDAMSQTGSQPALTPAPTTSTTKPGKALSPAQPQRIAARREQFDGFSFELPMGWSRVAPDRPKTKAMLLLGGDRWDTSKGVIKVDAGAPTTPDQTAMAEGLAKNFGGTVQPGLSDVDGERGFQVRAASQGVGLSPKRGIVVFRGGKVFLIMAGAIEGVDVSEAIEHVRATWKWGE